MKSQMSLEMIIGLLILLVVAAVVIKLFLNSTQGLGTQQYTKALQYRNFKAQCESLCSDAQASTSTAAGAKFCYTKLIGDTDLNGNKIKNDVFPAETKLLNVCEDGVYCFMVTECSSQDGGKIDWPDCRQILCNAFYDVYKDYGKVNDKVKAIFANGIGSCSLPAGDANWYNLYFGTNPCTEGPTTSSQTTTTVQSSVVSLQCSGSGTSISCNWTCPNAVSVQNPGYLSISVVNQAITFTQQTGSYTFSNLKTGTTYGIGLVCDVSNAQLNQGTTVQL